MGAANASVHSEEIIAASPAMQRILQLVRRIAPTESNIVITGESGTGKEKVARQIHYQSKRSRAPFVAVNAGAIPDSLMESELFGHVRGAFTDAKTSKRGFFEVADRGTLFLDEIAEMSPQMQVKLLRALQEREIRPVGGESPIRVDVRVVAATNRDLRALMKEGRFREDLFYRLNVFHLHVPALRDRKEDIPYLVSFFLARFSRRFGKRVGELSDRAWGHVMNYDFPGNVRELENAIERGVILADGETIKVRDLPAEIVEHGVPRLDAAEARERVGGGEPGSGSAEAGYSPELSLAEVEARHIEKVIARFGGNLSAAARSLGVSRSTLWRKMKRYGISNVPK
ncbi:MAG: AAA domain-containing protein [Candidatus Eisenbacteria bacterium]|nr:AAA domain-containing protein [Candidatus Eisenbacteria bacterium]